MEQNEKSALRRRILNLLRGQEEEERLKKSKVIRDKLLAAPEFQRARVVLFYASFDGEVETFDLMKQAKKLGKKIALPMTIKDQKKIIPAYVEDLEHELAQGPYGIQQPKEEHCRPVELKDIDLAIVPAVAFDRHNNRLGRGEGYYDRFLGDVSSTIPTIGLAFDFQIVDCLPHEEHDVAVSRVLVN